MIFIYLYCYLQKNLSAKSTTQVVRIAYVSLVAAGVRSCGVTQQQREALLPTLTTAVEKAAQQPLQVMYLVATGVQMYGHV